ncbi:hypothetical protein D3C74_437060 [compost metagenome]
MGTFSNIRSELDFSLLMKERMPCSPWGVCSGKETPFLTPKSAARFITSRLALGSQGESQSSLFQKMGWVCFRPRKTTGSWVR